MSHGGINNYIYIKMWSRSSSPQKNCKGVGLGEEASFPLAQPYEHGDIVALVSGNANMLLIENNWKQACY